MISANMKYKYYLNGKEIVHNVRNSAILFEFPESVCLDLTIHPISDGQKFIRKYTGHKQATVISAYIKKLRKNEK